MVTIACVKWGNKYTPDYVNILYNSVKRNLTTPFKFACFTENPAGLLPEIQILKLSNSLQITHASHQGWWYKIELFAPNNGLTGRVFYLDLDTAVTGNIDGLVNVTKDFIIVRDFYRGVRELEAAQSCLMAWTAGSHNHLYTKFMQNADEIMKTTGGGDQIWIQNNQQERKYWQDLFPNQVISFKVHCMENKREWKSNSILPNDTRVVCFHGLPRPHEVANHAWMKEHWR